MYSDPALRHKFSQKDRNGKCKTGSLSCSENYREQKYFANNIQTFIENLLLSQVKRKRSKQISTINEIKNEKFGIKNTFLEAQIKKDIQYFTPGKGIMYD